MNWLGYIWHPVMGILLGLAVIRVPAFKTIGWLLCGILDSTGVALVVYFTTSSLLQEASALQQGTDEFGTVLILEEPMTPEEIVSFIKVKAVYLLLGLGVGAIMAYCGWRGLGAGGTWIVLVLVLIFKHAYQFEVYILIALVTIGTQLLISIGVTAGPIVMISLLTQIGVADPKIKTEPFWDVHRESTNLWTFLVGAFTGVMPGLNAEALHESQIEGWLSSTMSEGVSLGILLAMRETSKTTLTTFLVQYTDSLDIVGVIAIILITILFVVLNPMFINWAGGEQLQLHGYMGKALTVLTTATFINIPGQPALSLLLAGGLFVGVSLIRAPMAKGLPAGFSKSLAMSPILLSA